MWLVGPTGVGKTTQIYNKYGIPHCYLKDPKTKWWDGFDPLFHTVIIIDDYPNTEPKNGLSHSDLLHICQPFPYMAETKGGHVQLMKQKIYITSNWEPDYIWPTLESANAVKSLSRRLFIREVKNTLKEEFPQFGPVQQIEIVSSPEIITLPHEEPEEIHEEVSSILTNFNTPLSSRLITPKNPFLDLEAIEELSDTQDDPTGDNPTEEDLHFINDEEEDLQSQIINDLDEIEEIEETEPPMSENDGFQEEEPPKKKQKSKHTYDI